MTPEQLMEGARVKAQMVAELVAEFGLPADVALAIVNQELAGHGAPKQYGL